jgi:hypothetical protein
VEAIRVLRIVINGMMVIVTKLRQKPIAGKWMEFFIFRANLRSRCDAMMRVNGGYFAGFA